jgi:hypothetical protein
MLIHGLNLFPLTKTHVRAVGYYMDQDGEIWSTRARAGRLTKLKGSRTSSGRYITLQTNGSFGQIHRLSDLQSTARAHRDFTTDTTVATAKIDLASALGLRGATTQQRGMHGMPQGLKAPLVAVPPPRGVRRPLVVPVCLAPTPAGERHHVTNATEGIQKRGWYCLAGDCPREW